MTLREAGELVLKIEKFWGEAAGERATLKLARFVGHESKQPEFCNWPKCGCEIWEMCEDAGQD